MSKKRKVPVWGERRGGNFPGPPVNPDGSTQPPPPPPPDERMSAANYHAKYGDSKKV